MWSDMRNRVLVPHSGNCAVIIIAQANGFTTFGFFSIWKRASLELPPPLIMNPVKFCFGENEIFETRCFLGNPKKNIIRSPLPPPYESCKIVWGGNEIFETRCFLGKLDVNPVCKHGLWRGLASLAPNTVAPSWMGGRY
ncbi:hypothetical protein TNCV_615881 [Trichonephila clavipes]|nr:hypothetical protein TNCV_615881 [Trichonephila clavipes]